MADPANNKAIVLDFYESVVNARDFDAAARHLGTEYVQHREDAEDGPAGLAAFIDRMRQAYPQSHCEVKRSFSDGDYVILHVHVVRTPGEIGSKHVDIFRVEGEHVVEHWDIDQPISTDTVNPNGPF